MPSWYWGLLGLPQWQSIACEIILGSSSQCSFQIGRGVTIGQQAVLEGAMSFIHQLSHRMLSQFQVGGCKVRSRWCKGVKRSWGSNVRLLCARLISTSDWRLSKVSAQSLESGTVSSTVSEGALPNPGARPEGQTDDSLERSSSSSFMSGAWG